MKKCKITLEPRAKQKCFYLAPSAEMLYLVSAVSTKKKWIKNLRSNPDIDMISLDHDQWIEAEWNGCQNIRDDFDTVRMNFVRLIKIAKLTSGKDSDALISIHFGWILGNHLKFNNHKNSGMKVTLLSKDDEQYDFSELFQDNDTHEDITKKLKIENLC